ncbi:CAP domain-containing protein [Flammeovirga pectinis]|uniref:CAP domain-containing protein n=1 Tax=Flammeovirga pectinis TaxID=2494373 RepID=A0A3S9PA43_9BACT|nr:CAP domain-containing protein [Flammeovirga pectinis]AZQ64952.1 CAP domain-containing protein [Flammeovirga pectinis]
MKKFITASLITFAIISCKKDEKVEPLKKENNIELLSQSFKSKRDSIAAEVAKKGKVKADSTGKTGATGSKSSGGTTIVKKNPPKSTTPTTGSGSTSKGNTGTGSHVNTGGGSKSTTPSQGIPPKKINGLNSPTSSTGIVAYSTTTKSGKADTDLLSLKELSDLVYLSTVTPAQEKWSREFVAECNKARAAFASGEAAWENYVLNDLQISRQKFIDNEISYVNVVRDINNLKFYSQPKSSQLNPQPLSYNKDLTIGSVKWQKFMLSAKDANSGKHLAHEDVGGKLGFDLSTKAEGRGTAAEVVAGGTTARQAVIDWIRDNGNKHTNWGHRTNILSADYLKAGGFADVTISKGQAKSVGRFTW